MKLLGFVLLSLIVIVFTQNDVPSTNQNEVFDNQEKNGLPDEKSERWVKKSIDTENKTGKIRNKRTLQALYRKIRGKKEDKTITIPQLFRKYFTRKTDHRPSIHSSYGRSFPDETEHKTEDSLEFKDDRIGITSTVGKSTPHRNRSAIGPMNYGYGIWGNQNKYDSSWYLGKDFKIETSSEEKDGQKKQRGIDDEDDDDEQRGTKSDRQTSTADGSRRREEGQKKQRGTNDDDDVDDDDHGNRRSRGRHTKSDRRTTNADSRRRGRQEGRRGKKKGKTD